LSDALDDLARGWRAWAIIAAVTLLAVLPGFFSMPPLDRDESRFAQASAQMLETGDFVHIRLQDEPRNKKPIGAYWAQAASVAMFSSAEARAIWAYRIPSLCGALLAAWATFWAGTALVGRRAAFAGAALLGASLLLSTEGMIAKTDALVAGFTTLAMAALARAYAGAGAAGTRTMLLFWVALAAGVLMKGPLTPLVVGLCVIALCAWERRWRWLKPLIDARGAALAAAIAAPWFIAIALDDGRFFAQSLGGDVAPKLLRGDEDHGAPPGVHLALLAFLIFPATLGLLPAFGDGWRALRAPRDDAAHRATRFLVAWAAPIWLVFELAATKLAHYTLPAYPAIALLAGAGVLRWLDAGGWRKAALIGCYLVGGLGLAAVCAYLATLAPGDPGADLRRAVQAAIVAGGVLAMGATAMALARRADLVLAIAIATALALTFTARERIAPEARTVLLTREAMQVIWREGLHISPELPLLSVGYREPSLVFMAGTNTLLRQGGDAARDAAPGQTALVDSRERLAFDVGLAARGLAFTPFGDAVRGHNYSNGESVTLQPGRVAVLEETRG
jgi:4-amino-4-deoxy-L-arabinose transferase-like glycosyltransferase